MISLSAAARHLLTKARRDGEVIIPSWLEQDEAVQALVDAQLIRRRNHRSGIGGSSATYELVPVEQRSSGQVVPFKAPAR